MGSPYLHQDDRHDDEHGGDQDREQTLNQLLAADVLPKNRERHVDDVDGGVVSVGEVAHGSTAHAVSKTQAWISPVSSRVAQQTPPSAAHVASPTGVQRCDAEQTYGRSSRHVELRGAQPSGGGSLGQPASADMTMTASARSID
jgi:hypothetical protein